MKNPDSTLLIAVEIHCRPGESLWQLSGDARDFAMRFCVANDVALSRVAKEFHVTLHHLRLICECVMRPPAGR